MQLKNTQVHQAEKNSKKLLVICGSTSTGKTSLALRLAKKFKGELVSADSRQVYKKINIGTGKDIPHGFRFKESDIKVGGISIGFYKKGDLCIWGYDLVDPGKTFSVQDYLTITEKVIADIWKRKKLPIVVGGTGLYIKGIVDGIPTSFIPKNNKLRSQISGETADELFKMLIGINKKRAERMNDSDRKNPRRLIRAIEIEKDKSIEKKKCLPLTDEVLMIGLKAPGEYILEKIKKRVKKRMEMGAVCEICKLLKSVHWDSQSMTSLGIRQWKPYFEGSNNYELIINDWIKQEFQYAKRQMTWFRKETYSKGRKRIIWFDISKRNQLAGVEKEVKKWYK